MSGVDKQIDKQIGVKVAELLSLKIKGDRFDTSWGTKTYIGLGACIRRIVSDIVSETNNKTENKTNNKG